MSFRVLLFVVSLSTLVLGDANHKFVVTKLEFDNKPCELFGQWSGKFEDGRGSTSKLFFDFSVEQDIPEGTMVNMKIEMPGQDPIEKEVDLIDGLEDKTIGESFVMSVTPEGLTSGPPIPKGSYSAKKWVPSMHAVPSGVEGEARITASIGDCVTIVCVGHIRY